MPHKTTFQYTRPNTSVEWYTQSPAYSTLFKTELVDTGKISFSAPVISEDGLRRTHQATWASDADRLEWLSRETTQAEIRNRLAYCAANGITLNVFYDDV